MLAKLCVTRTKSIYKCETKHQESIDINEERLNIWNYFDNCIFENLFAAHAYQTNKHSILTTNLAFQKQEVKKR